MVDSLSPAQRSARMALIGGKNTSPEVALRKAVHALGLRFRLHGTHLPGKPDLVFAKHSAVVLVHGCFWHRHWGCKIATTPKSNTEFWIEKFEKNVARDKRVERALVDLGWRVFVVWECEVNTPIKAKETAEHLAKKIRGEPAYPFTFI